MSEPTDNAELRTPVPTPSLAPASGNRQGLIAVISVLALASLVVLSLPVIPLGVPGEWVWARRLWTEIDPLAIVQAGLLGIGYWSVVIRGEKWLTRPDGSMSGTAIASLCLLAFAWQLAVHNVAPDYQGIGRAPSVLYYKRTEGYFWQAAFEVRESRDFLHSYADSIGSGDDPDRYLHLGTHPPGLTLGYCGLLALCKSSPTLTQTLLILEPAPVRDGFAALKQFPTPRGDLLSPPEEATLWAGTLLTLLAAAATCWPVYRLAFRMGGPVAGWRAAVLWPLVPSLLVFFPKSDLLCPSLATMSCWLWLDGWSRLSWARCVLAGVGFFVGAFLTLALAPIALLLVAQTVLERWSRREEFRDRSWAVDLGTVLAAAIGFAVPFVAVSVWGECNVFTIWIQNLKNHAMFYAHNSRSYGTWLLVNPIEAALAIGVPVACLVGLGLLRSIRLRKSEGIGFSQSLAWLGVWGFLWLSGKNMGEAARLWIVLAPWPVMTAAVAIAELQRRPEADTTGHLRPLGSYGGFPWRLLLAVQVVAALWTSVCVDGFHFEELMR